LGIPLPRGREFEEVIMVEVFDRRDVWVGPKPTARLPTSHGRRSREERERKRKTLSSEKRSVLKKSLTGPTLLEMSD
jgi:hypothetical protein